MRAALWILVMFALVACAHAQLDNLLLVVPAEADGEPVLGDCASAHIAHADAILGVFGCYNINLNRVEVHMFTDTETPEGDELNVERITESIPDEGVTSAVWDVRVSSDGAYVWFVSNATFPNVQYPDTDHHSSRVYFLRVSDRHLQVGCNNVHEAGGASTMGHLSVSDDGHRAAFHMVAYTLYGPLRACYLTSVDDINQQVLTFTTVPFTIKDGVYTGNSVGAWHPSISGDGSHVVFISDEDLTAQLANNTSLFPYPWKVDVNDLGTQDFKFHLLLKKVADDVPASAGCSLPDTNSDGSFSIFMCNWNSETHRPTDFPILYLYEDTEELSQLLETGPWAPGYLPYQFSYPHLSTTEKIDDIRVAVDLQSVESAGTLPLESAFITKVNDDSQFDYMQIVCGARMFDFFFNDVQKVAVFTTNRNLALQDVYETSADVNVWLWFGEDDDNDNVVVCPSTHGIGHHPSKARAAIAVVFSTLVAFVVTASVFAYRRRLNAIV